MTARGAVRETEAWTDDVATPGHLRRVTAALDRDPHSRKRCAVLPSGWHVGLSSTGKPQSGLRLDGYAGSSMALPDLELPPPCDLTDISDRAA